MEPAQQQGAPGMDSNRRRVRLHSSDYYFLLVLGLCAVMVLFNWDDYDACDHPLHVWLLVNYFLLFLFRFLAFYNQYLLHNAASSASCRFLVGGSMILGVYPAMWVWTILGTVWFNESGTCLAESSHYWGFVVWLGCIYIYLVLFTLLLALGVCSFLAVRRASGGSLADTARTLDHLRRLQALQSYGAPLPNPGLTPTEIETLATRTLNVAPPDNLATCSICYDDLEVGHEVRVLPCIHLFHTECIDPWLSQKRTCPNCNQDVTQPLNSGVAAGNVGSVATGSSTINSTTPSDPDIEMGVISSTAAGGAAVVAGEADGSGSSYSDVGESLLGGTQRSTRL